MTLGTLVVTGPDIAPLHLGIHSTTVRIGRDPHNEITLPRENVSRFHCMIELRDGEATLVDLNSTWGTLVDQCPVQRVVLRGGEKIQVGEYSVLYYPEQPSMEGGPPTQAGSHAWGQTPPGTPLSQYGQQVGFQPTPAWNTPAQPSPEWPPAQGVQWSGAAGGWSPSVSQGGGPWPVSSPPVGPLGAPWSIPPDMYVGGPASVPGARPKHVPTGWIAAAVVLLVLVAYRWTPVSQPSYPGSWAAQVDNVKLVLILNKDNTGSFSRTRSQASPESLGVTWTSTGSGIEIRTPKLDYPLTGQMSQDGKQLTLYDRSNPLTFTRE